MQQCLERNEEVKKAVSILGWIHFVLVVLLPGGTLLSACFGYTFELASVRAFAIVTALLSVCLVVLSLLEKEGWEGSVDKVRFALLAPLSLISAVFYMLAYSRKWVVVSVFVCIACCFWLTIKHGKPLSLKIAAFMLSALLFLPICFFGFLTLIFGDFGEKTVVQSVESPSGAYYAEVVSDDQGALGGATLVNVYENKGINALVFKISKKPQRVYFGRYYEYENMKIYWKDDKCLVINSASYAIK